MRSEGCNRFKNEIEKLYISMLSHGSEGVSWILYKRSMLNIGMLSHGSESKYAIAPLVL